MSCSTSSTGSPDRIGSPAQLVKGLKELFHKREGASDEEVSELLRTFPFQAQEWDKFTHFSSDRYVRNLVAADRSFSLLLMCWMPGQATPIHSHSLCSGGTAIHSYVRVVSGTLKLALFDHDPSSSSSSSTTTTSSSPPTTSPFSSAASSKTPHTVVTMNRCTAPKETADPRYQAGVLTETDENPLGFHQLSNEGSTPAISLHIYSPPYTTCPYSVKGDESSYVPCVFHPDSDLSEESSELVDSVLVNPTFGSLNDLIQILRSEIKFSEDGRSHPQCNIQHVLTILSNFHLNPHEWEPYVTKSKAKYTRNVIAFEKKFTMILLVWDKHQFSPIHDHASSNCFVKVLHGKMQETKYSASGYDLPDAPEGAEQVRIIARSNDVHSPGAVTYIRDAHGLHKMGNPSSSGVTCSLHIYSPPYRECNVFRVQAPEVTPETVPQAIYDCRKEKVCMTTIYGSQDRFYRMATDASSSSSSSSSPSSPPLFPTSPPRSPPPCMSIEHQPMDSIEESSTMVVASPADAPDSPHCLSTLGAILRRTFACPAITDRCGALRSVLDQIAFSPEEWKQYVHFCPQRYSRNLLLLDEAFSLILICWAPGQGTPVHDHGGNDRKSWVRVLSGTVLYTEYAEDGQTPVATNVHTPDGDSFFTDTSEKIHQLTNPSSEEPAISLHLYSPPLIHCSYFDQQGAVKLHPASFCSSEKIHSPKEERPDESAACARQLCRAQCRSALRIALQTQEAVYTNIPSFTWVISELFAELVRGHSSAGGVLSKFSSSESSKLLHLMRAIQFDRQEWFQYAPALITKATYSMIASSDLMSLYLFAWPPNCASRSCSYTFDQCRSSSWTRILEGNLEEIQYTSELVETQLNDLPNNTVIFRPPTVVSRFYNKKRKPSYSLHLFSPPLFLSPKPDCCQ